MIIKLIEDFASKVNFLNYKGSYTSVVDALNDNASEDIDLIFLDVELPEMSGIEYLKNFRKKPMIIMISTYPDYAVDAFEYEAVDFLLKPFVFSRFFRSVQKAVKMNKFLEMQFNEEE